MMPDETEESWLRRSNQRNWSILQVVDEVARAHRATHSQVALAWLLPSPRSAPSSSERARWHSWMTTWLPVSCLYPTRNLPD